VLFGRTSVQFGVCHVVARTTSCSHRNLITCSYCLRPTCTMSASAWFSARTLPTRSHSACH